MDAETFKQTLKGVVVLNPKGIEYNLSFIGKVGRETFTTNKDFGNRILEVFADPDFEEIEADFIKEKGFFGTRRPLDDLLKHGSKNVERLDFRVTTKSYLERELERVKNMSAEDAFYYKGKLK